MVLFYLKAPFFKEIFGLCAFVLWKRVIDDVMIVVDGW